MRADFIIGDKTVPPGSALVVDLPVGSFSNHMPSTMPVRIIHGRRDGPALFVSAAIHGDEVIGVEIIRRLLASSAIKGLKGTLICIPVVNTFGFVNQSRYLPDRRDLNRTFPGADNGSLAGQLANLFTKEILGRSNYGIDIHSAARHRVNLPQIRYNSTNDETHQLAQAFGAPLILKAPFREQSMRMTAHKMGVEVLLYEAGEALRFDEMSVRVGLRGILNVMHKIGMISAKRISKAKITPTISEKSKWIRSPVGGLFRGVRAIGDFVKSGTILAYVSDPFGLEESVITAPFSGIVIGRSNLPVINPGDAIFHVATVKKPEQAGEAIASVEEEIEMDPLFDEDEII